MTRRSVRYPMSIGEFIVSAACTALTFYAVGSVMGVQWFG